MKARLFRSERAYALAEVFRLQSEAYTYAQLAADPKGASDAGTAGALTAIIHAVNDALHPCCAQAFAQLSVSESIWQPLAACRDADRRFTRRTQCVS